MEKNKARNMLNTVLLIICSSLATCAVIFTLAKRSAPITANDAKVLWVMHRKTAHCSGHKWQPIKLKKGKIVGFRCQCGYKYTQKRPLVSGSLKQCGEQPELPAFYSF
jgi:hypothetical protein